MSGQKKVSGVVLAGGLARRMQNADKGLVEFNSQPLVSYALAAMQPLADELLISANRNQNSYRQFGYPVIGDSRPDFEGPLAGILSALQTVKHSVLLVMPCDSPLVTYAHLQRLLSELNEEVDLAVAFDGQRLHPVFLALKTDLQISLIEYLQNGERKLENWLYRHKLKKVDFSDVPEVFQNINTLAELNALEQAFVNLLRSDQ